MVPDTCLFFQNILQPLLKEDFLPDMPATPALRLLAWETTRRCNLDCRHCRAAATSGPYPGELTTAEGKSLLDDVAGMGHVVVILTGGEPLLREDILEITAYGTGWDTAWSWP